MSKLSNKVFEALGQASMYWSETPLGVFDDKEAVKVGEDLMKSIEESQMRFAEWCSYKGWIFSKHYSLWQHEDFGNATILTTSELLELFNKENQVNNK